MDQTQKERIKDLIKIYEEKGRDWSSAVEFEAVKGNGHLKAFQFGLGNYQAHREKFLKHEALIEQNRQRRLERQQNG
jgi:hypothetical protein